MDLILTTDNMDAIKIFNKLLSDKGAKGYLIEKREMIPGPIKACRTAVVELWYHEGRHNQLVQSFKKKGMITDAKKDDVYEALEDEVLYHLFDNKEEVLSYGVQ